MWKRGGPFGLLLVIVIALTSNCTGSEVRRYELTGQVVAVTPPRSEITIAHDAIPGYMPAMTMSFRVKGVASLGEIKPGDLVRAGLVITREDGFIERLQTTGHRDVSSATFVPAADHVDYLLEGDRVPDLGLVVVFVRFQRAHAKQRPRKHRRHTNSEHSAGDERP